MEQLQVTALGTVNVETIELNDRLDHDFKPGLYRQTEAFIVGDDTVFCSLAQQVDAVRIYSEMAGYV